MRKERVTAVIEVAQQLFAAENAIDKAYQEIAELNAKMTSARLATRMSAVVGQEALESASESLTTLAQARHRLVRTHHLLDDVKTGLGLRELAIGGMAPKPIGRAMQLNIVEDVAA